MQRKLLSEKTSQNIPDLDNKHIPENDPRISCRGGGVFLRKRAGSGHGLRLWIDRHLSRPMPAKIPLEKTAADPASSKGVHRGRNRASGIV